MNQNKHFNSNYSHFSLNDIFIGHRYLFIGYHSIQIKHIKHIHETYQTIEIEILQRIKIYRQSYANTSPFII
jgi:hypothetical protein